MRLRRSLPSDVVVGLDLSPGRIKLVGLSRSASGIAVVCAADDTMPSGGGTGRFDPAAVAAEVARILARHRLHPRSVALSLGPAEGVARRLTVVSQDRPQTLAALSLQLGQALGADVTAPRVGYCALAAPAPQGRTTIFAAAARTEAVAAQQRAVSAPGFEQGPVTTAAVALVNCWRACRPRAADDGRVVLLHVGHTAALWVVLDDGEPVALDAPLVGFASMSERLGARGATFPDSAAPAPGALGDWAGRLRQEIARGLQTVRRESGGAGAGEHAVWVSGGALRVPGLVDALRGALGSPVHTFDPVAGLPSAAEPGEAFGPALVPAFGAALQGLAAQGADFSSPLFDIDLRAPAEPRVAAGRVALPLLAQSIARGGAFRGIAAAGLVLLTSTSFLGARLRDAGREVAAREARVATDSTAVAAAMSRSALLEERRRAMGTRVEAVHALEHGRDAWPRLLQAISSSVPGSAWVSEIVADAEDPATGEVAFTIRGYASGEQVAGAFARGLLSTGAAGEARVVRTAAVTIGRTPLVRFEISGRASELSAAAAGGAP